MQSSPSKALKIIKAHVSEANSLLNETHPDAVAWLKDQQLTLKSIREQQFETTRNKISAKILKSKISDAVQITEDERFAIWEKLKLMAMSPSADFISQDHMYLEQQLSDLFGIEIITEVQGFELQQNVGIIDSERHHTRFPKDDLSMHEDIKEAGINLGRPEMNWLLNSIDEDKSFGKEQEKYSIFIDLHKYPEWSQNRISFKNKLKNLRVIVINPFNKRAAIAGILGSLKKLDNRRQFAGSPELNRTLLSWSLEAQGRVLIFFVNNDDKDISLGYFYSEEL